MLSVVCVLALALSACNTSPEQLNRAAEVVLTRSAELTPGALSAGDSNTAGAADAPTRDPNAGPVTATPSLVFALCIIRAESQLRIEPNDDAAFTASLQARDVITAYGRTTDAAWVLGWNKDDNYGWVTASAVGCTVPTPELMPTEPNVLRLTPVAVVAEAATNAAPAPSATAEPTLATPTDTPIPPTPTTAATDTPAPSPEPEPTNTAEPATAEPTPTATQAAAAVAQTPSPTPIVIIQIVTVVVTVTAAPAEAAVVLTPTLAPTTTPAATPSTAITATPALTATAAATETSSLVVLQQVRCVVTPGTPVNLRRGPARTERLLGTLRSGAPFVVTGRNEAGDWLYGVTARGTIGWLITSAVGCESDANKLPVVDR
jgi:hypothetical protein